MVLKRIGYTWYDTDDIIGRCPKCAGVMYDAPDLASLLTLTENEIETFESGLWTIGYCPICYYAEVIPRVF